MYCLDGVMTRILKKVVNLIFYFKNKICDVKIVTLDPLVCDLADNLPLR